MAGAIQGPHLPDRGFLRREVTAKILPGVRSRQIACCQSKGQTLRESLAFVWDATTCTIDSCYWLLAVPPQSYAGRAASGIDSNTITGRLVLFFSARASLGAMRQESIA